MQTAKGTVAPAACQLRSSLYLFPMSFHREDKWWRALPGEGGSVHSNILSGAYACTSICGSGWIWCGEDAAALVSDVLRGPPRLPHSTRTRGDPSSGKIKNRGGSDPKSVALLARQQFNK